MKYVKHHSIVRNCGNGSRCTTTLCGRSNKNADSGYLNIADNTKDVTCKNCLKISRTVWGKEIIKNSIK